MPGVDLSLYLVTGPAGDVRHLVRQVEAAVEGGVTTVQLRGPAATSRQLVDTARRLVELLAPRGVPLVVNDRLDVALAAGAGGVHLGQSDLHPLDARRLAGPGMVIGWSVTEPGQVEEIGTWPPGTVDYIGAGPVHPTGSKPDAAAPMGYAGLERVARTGAVPVVAIGGIGVEHVGACLAAGAVGVAVVSAIWSARDPRAAAQALRLRLGAGGEGDLAP